jgi:hypothetical protein
MYEQTVRLTLRPPFFFCSERSWFFSSIEEWLFGARAAVIAGVQEI